MIKTQELRIGNIVSVNKGFEMTVVAIFKDTVYLDFEGNEGDVWEEKEEDIFPIPFTEELLKKIGEIRTVIKPYFEYIVEDVVFQFNENLALEYTAGEGLKLSQEINSLHRLQNLLFELKDTELTIKK